MKHAVAMILLAWTVIVTDVVPDHERGTVKVTFALFDDDQREVMRTTREYLPDADVRLSLRQFAERMRTRALTPTPVTAGERINVP